jgi:TonB family protein
MPPTETPPNPAPPASPQPPANESIKIATRKYGELDHSELVHLLDSLEGDQAKSRFRESIYISIIFYLALAWLLVYGPKYVFHTGTIVPTAASIREKERLTEMALNRDLQKSPPKPPKPPPKLDRKLIEQLQAMQRANQAAKAAQAPPAPTPAPAPAPAPLPPAAPPAVAQNQLPSAPTPQPAPQPRQSAIPDSPMPQNPAPQSPGQSIADAMRAAGQPKPGGGRSTAGSSSRVGQQGAGTGVEILSDTRGVDFTDYIKRLLRMVKAAWLPLIPEECYPPLSKEGTTLIRFTIEPNGVVSAMHLDDSTHDRAIDKAAWGAITGVGQFAPLPKEYKGPNLELRIQFIISRNAQADDF